MTYKRAIVVAAAFGVMAGAVIAMRVWLASRPAWYLSAHNVGNGVVIEVYKGHQAKPTYSTLLKRCSIPHDIDRLPQQQLPSAVGTTLFSDETIRPGRWTVVVAGEKLDIMERAMILGDGTEVPPDN
jgi:hypothetical protein